MQPTIIHKFKWFWPWQDDKEEDWLSEMSRQGWHFTKIVFPTLYSFTRSEPQNYIYRLDYISSRKAKEDYLQLFGDAGWEHVQEMAGWQYFRKLAQEGESPEIYTDNESKIQKYKRLLTFLSLMLGMLVMIYISVLTSSTSPLSPWLKWIYIVLIGVYMFMLARLAWRIRELKRL